MTTTIAATPLTASDRCDRCNAQAYVRVVLNAGSELLFCAHHYSKFSVNLQASAREIHDETHRLDEGQKVNLGEF